jgi:hypothetical protein
MFTKRATIMNEDMFNDLIISTKQAGASIEEMRAMVVHLKKLRDSVQLAINEELTTTNLKDDILDAINTTEA